MAAPIEFYFDFASPYGYLAATQIDALGARVGRTVEWKPILLGAVFKVTGQRPNMERPLAGEYLLHDVPRFARLLGVKLTVPARMPIAALAACRAFWWLQPDRPELARLLALAVYRAHWGEGRDLGPAEAVAEVAADLGIDPAALAAGIQDPAVKDRLRAVNDEAVAKGVFGSPFFIADGEPFWGADRLGQLERWLETGGW